MHKIDSVARLVVASNPSWSKLYELMTKVLNDYALIDNVPRVKNNIKRLINNWDEIL